MRHLDSTVRAAATLLVMACSLAAPAAGQAPEILELTSLQAVFDSTGYHGTVVIYDLRNDRLSAVHATGAPRRLIPASTFKILNSLIALETGVVQDAATVIPWDSVPRERAELNRDLDLRSAFRLSAVPHFQELARRIGSERMSEWVGEVGYGNADVEGGIDTFWLTGDLAISPLEQIDLLVRLYRDELPFSERTMAIVREIMTVEETPQHTIRGKTGWGILPDGHVGWWVGWVERGPDVFFFATAIETEEPDDSFAGARAALTRRALRALGALD